MTTYHEPNQELDGDIVPADIPDGLGFAEYTDFDHFYGTLDTPEDEVLPDTEEVKPKDRKERFNDIHERFKFYAGSFNELNDAVLLDSDDLHHDAVAFLATIYNHQARNYKKKQDAEGTRTEDPKKKVDTIGAAVRAILGRFTRYATDARANAGFSIELTKLLVAADLNANEPIERAVKDIYPDAEAVWRPLVNLLRLHDSIEFVEKDGDEHIDDKYYDSSNIELQARLAEFVATLSSRKALKLIAADVKQQQARSKYWADKLIQVTYHGNTTVRAIAHTGLGKLGINQPE